MIMRLVALAATLLATLAGCATITSLGNTFEGATDYRIVPVTDPRYPENDIRRTPLVSECATRQAATPAARQAEAVQCPLTNGRPPAMERVRLSDYSLFQGHPATVPATNSSFFSSGDNIQISLRMGLVGWFSEGVEQRFVNRLFGTQVKGEIAIIANVTDKEVTPAGLTTQGNLDGRVVFYSGDVYQEQRLNEFNVPIYGPNPYTGGALTVDLWVLELDRAESEQMSAILGTLSRLSGETTGGGIPGLSILNQIGSAFLNSNRDDIIGRVRITLMPPRAGQQVTDPILQISDVVISRTSRSTARGMPNMLDDCYYEPETARVLTAQGGQCGAPAFVHRNNFFVLAVRKVEQTRSIASTWTLQELTDRLRSVQVGTGQTPDLNAAVDQISDVFISGNAYSDSIAAVERIRAGSAGAARQQAADRILQRLQCGLLFARDGTSTVLTQACGGERAAQRQMGPADLDRLTQRLAADLCLTEADLSFASLLGSPATVADMPQKRQALYPLFRPRPADHATGQCPPA